MRVSFLVLVASALMGLRAGAQTPVPGERLRVEYSDRARAIGTFDSLSTDSVFLRDLAGSRSFAVSRVDIRRLERSMGSQRHFGRNFGITMGISALAVAGLSAASWQPCRDPGYLGVGCLFTPESRFQAFGWGLLGGALVGVPLGVIIGVAIRSEAWASVALPATHGPSLELSPVLGRRLGVVGTIRLGRAEPPAAYRRRQHRNGGESIEHGRVP